MLIATILVHWLYTYKIELLPIFSTTRTVPLLYFDVNVCDTGDIVRFMAYSNDSMLVIARIIYAIFCRHAY